MPPKFRDTRASSTTTTAAPAATTERTAIYCRISLDAEGAGLGVQRQEAECRELCDRNGWEVSEVYVDNDISATSGKRRPEFERLLADPPTRVVVWHTDRLVRLTEELDRVIRIEIPVHTVTAGDLDLSTPAGRAVARTITAWARYEGEQKSLRQQSSHRQRARAGRSFWSHRRPFGFTEAGDHLDVEADALRECYGRLRQGDTFAACAAWLTSEGLTTTRGERWDGSRLSRTMRHPRNAGLSVYRDEIVGQGEWESIVPEEEWRAILARSEAMPRAKGADAARGGQVRSLLGGLVVCAECGEKVRRTRQQSSRKGDDGQARKVYAYVYQPRCQHVAVRADWLDEHVTKAVWRAAASPARALADGPEVAPEEAQQAAAEAVSLRERLEDVARREAMDELTSEQAKVQNDVLRQRLADAEAKAVAYYSASPLDRAYSPSTIVAAWKSGEMSLQHQREAVVRYVESITVRPRLNRNERANPDMVTIKIRKWK